MISSSLLNEYTYRGAPDGGLIAVLRQKDEPNKDYVVVPRWAIDFIMENAQLCDTAVSDAGYPSAKMRQAEAAIEAVPMWRACWFPNIRLGIA